jgi:nucleoside-triphosphatase THEP1
MITFTKAEKAKAKARVLLAGASGSGKTTAARDIATALGKKVALIDTECGSASLYADRYSFDVLELAPPYEPERFIEAIQAAESAGYDVVVIDSITHEWSGPGGCLEIKTKLGDRFQDWAKVSPRHEKFVQSMLRSKAHIVATVRSKQGYAMDEKGKVQKQGMEPQQRDGLDFEFTLVLNINQAHIAESSKDRTRLFDGKQFQITRETGSNLLSWLESGVESKQKIERPTWTAEQKTKAAQLADVAKAAGRGDQVAKAKEELMAENAAPEVWLHRLTIIANDEKAPW